MIGIFLKEQTKTLHDLVEEKLMSQKIMDKNFSIQEYHQLIRHNYSFIQHFENTVFSKISKKNADNLHLEERRKLPFLKKDLAVFGEVQPISESDFEIKNEAEALGILYVMEGATLGGNVILKSLSKNPQFEGVAIHYFGCYGDQTGIRWKKFKEVIEAEAQNYPAEDFLTGAKKAYQFLLDL